MLAHPTRPHQRFVAKSKSSETSVNIADIRIESQAELRPLNAVSDEIVGKNLHQLMAFVSTKSNLMHDIGVSKPRCTSLTVQPLYLAIQVVLAYMIFDRRLNLPHTTFQNSQQAVYESEEVSPLFHGAKRQKVNLSLLCHIANFFAYHTMRKDEGLAFDFFDGLVCRRPQAWIGKLRQDPPRLDSFWKGLACKIVESSVPNLVSRV